MKLATYPPLIVIIGLLVSVNFNNAATYRGRTGIQVPRSEMFRNEQLNNFQPKKLKKLKKLKKRKVAKYNDITTASTTTEVPRTKATTTYPEFSPDFSPSFGDWLGGVAGQLPFNFSDVQPKFVVQLKSNSNEESEESDTRKFGRPDILGQNYPVYNIPNQNIGILTPVNKQQPVKTNTFRVPGTQNYHEPEQHYANVLPPPTAHFRNVGNVGNVRNVGNVGNDNYSVWRRPQGNINGIIESRNIPLPYGSGNYLGKFPGNGGGGGNNAQPVYYPKDNQRYPFGNPNQNDQRGYRGIPIRGNNFYNSGQSQNSGRPFSGQSQNYGRPFNGQSQNSGPPSQDDLYGGPPAQDDLFGGPPAQDDPYGGPPRPKVPNFGSPGGPGGDSNRPFGLFKPQGFDISGPPLRNNNGPGPRPPQNNEPEHSLEQFGSLTDYLPGPDFEELKNGGGGGPEGPQSFIRGHQESSDESYYQIPPTGGDHNGGQYDTYLNENNLPPSSPDEDYSSGPEGYPSGPDGGPQENYPREGPPRGEGGYPRGEGGYPGGEGGYPRGEGGYPGGEGGYPRGEGGYPGGDGGYSGGGQGYPRGEDGYPGGEQGYPGGEGGYPGGEGGYPGGEERYPGGEQGYPGGEGGYPGGEERYPGGEGGYLGGERDYSGGPGGQGPYQNGPPRGRPDGDRTRPPPPINYRNLPLDHPLKWNDDSFYFDHDFKPLQNREGGGDRSREKPQVFFEDFTGFYNSNNFGSTRNQQSSRDFGLKDGFPNYFNGEQQKRRVQNPVNPDGFENFPEEKQKPHQPFRPSEPYGPPQPPPRPFRHNRTSPIQLPNRRLIKVKLNQIRKMKIVKQPIATII